MVFRQHVELCLVVVAEQVVDFGVDLRGSSDIERILTAFSIHAWLCILLVHLIEEYVEIV